MASFHASLVRPNENALIYAITSLSSASRNLEWLEYGYNRDGLDLPQVNLSLVISLEIRMPLLFKLFPGSVTTSVTLRNLAQEARSLGIDNCMFILDRGFYSESNVALLNEANIDFIMPLPFGRRSERASSPRRTPTSPTPRTHGCSRTISTRRGGGTGDRRRRAQGLRLLQQEEGVGGAPVVLPPPARHRAGAGGNESLAR